MLRARVADLLLDTDLYGAHSTGTDALWAGLPILVLASLCPMALGAMALDAMALGRTAEVTHYCYAQREATPLFHSQVGSTL